MTGQLYGLYIECGGDIEKCAADSRSRLTGIFESGVNYDGFCYPYFDSLLMSGHTEQYGIPFGTHALLWDGDGRLDGTDAQPVGFDYRDVLSFMTKHLYQPSEGELLLGGYELLAAGSTQPWALREHSRKFCSFCEHIGRMDGVELLGLTGGYAVVRLKNEEILDEIKNIYNAKTGGMCRVLCPGEAEPEVI